MGKKITQLATITEVADDDLIVGVDVSDTSGSDNGTNKKFTKATLLAGLAPLNPQLTGWNPDAETWVYHNVDDPTGYFKIEDKDVSANYSVGWRIMFTNGGNVIKGIITAITYSNPDTIITFLHEIDPTDNQALYLLQNSAITKNYTSSHKAPLGFPSSPESWTINTIDISRTVTGATAGTYYACPTTVSIPIGSWKYRLSGQLGCRYVFTATGTADTFCYVGLSSSSTSITEDVWSFGVRRYSVTGYVSFETRQVEQNSNIKVTTKTTYYVVGRATDSITDLWIGPYGAFRVQLTCAYL